MGAFSGMKNAKRGFASNPLKGPGRYCVRIDENAFFDYKTQSGDEAESWKVTLTVLAVDEGDSKEGEVCHVFFKCGDGVPKETFQGNLKSYVCGVLEADDEDFGEDEAKLCLDPDKSPLNGKVCIVTARLRASKKKTDKDGNPREFTNYSWSPALTKREIRQTLDAEQIEKFFPNGL